MSSHASPMTSGGIFPMGRRSLAWGAFLVAVAAVVGCQLKGAGTSASLAAPEDWDKRRWVEKVGKALSGGRTLPQADVGALAQLDDAAVVRQLMARPTFGDAV